MQSTRDMVRSWEASQGEAMVAARRVITLSIDSDQRRALVDISRSRSEATGRVERARIIAYLDTPSAYVVARQIGVSQPRAAGWPSQPGETRPGNSVQDPGSA